MLQYETLSDSGKTSICDEDWLSRLVVKHSTNMSESAHNVVWHYAPKEKFNRKEVIECAGILAMIHINSGQHRVSQFLQSIGYEVNGLHEVFKRADEDSKRRSAFNDRGYAADLTVDEQGDDFYFPGGVD